MLKNCILAFLLASAVVSTAAAAETPSRLDGAWIIDARATQEFVVGGKRPPDADKLARWFGLAAGYMALFTYEFKGGVAVLSAYRGDRVFTYQRVSPQDAVTRYVLKDSAGQEVDTLLVSMLNDESIMIVHAKSPEMAHLVWKRGQLTSEKAGPEDVMAAVRNWLAAVETIVKALRQPPAPFLSPEPAR